MTLPPLTFLAIEVAWLALFPVVVVAAYRESRFLGLCILAAVPFGFAIEFFDIRTYGTYYYNDFLVMLGPRPYAVPLCVCLAWSGIILAGHRTVSRYGVSWRFRPLAMGALAAGLDLYFDPIVASSKIVPAPETLCVSPEYPAGSAAGLGFWVWCNSPIERSFWFGVPVGNFFGWLFVVAGFALFIQIARRYLTADERPLWLQLLLVGFVSVGGWVTAMLILLGYGLLVYEAGLPGPVFFGLAMLPGVLAVARGASRAPDGGPDWITCAVVVTVSGLCIAYLTLGGVAGRMSAMSVVTLLAVMVASGTAFLWPSRGGLFGARPDADLRDD